MAAGLGALRDDDVHAGLHLADGVFAGTHQRRAGDFEAPSAFQHGRRRHAEGVGDQPDRMAEGDIHQLLARFPLKRRRRVGSVAVVAVEFLRRIDAVTAQQVVHESAVFGRDLRGEVGGACAGLGADGQVLGDQQIDPVRLAADMVVDPAEFGFQLLRRVARCAEDPEPAGLADRGDDVAAVGEGKEREVDV